MRPAAFSCQLCDQLDCDAAFQVLVPTDDTVTVPAVLLVGRECRDDAIRWLEGQDYAAGPAQVDPLSYGGAA